MMLKNKFKFFVFFIFLVIVLFNLFCLDNDDYKLTNNVEFKGIVTDFKSSNNHSFGIISIRVLKSNTKKFNAFQNKNVYPYNLDGDKGEIYDYVPVSLKKGFIVYVNSKTGKIAYYKNKKYVIGGNIFLITDDLRIKYIKEEKTLNN